MHFWDVVSFPLSLCFRACCLALIKTQSPFQQHTVLFFFHLTLSFPQAWPIESILMFSVTEKTINLAVSGMLQKFLCRGPQ